MTGAETEALRESLNTTSKVMSLEVVEAGMEPYSLASASLLITTVLDWLSSTAFVCPYLDYSAHVSASVKLLRIA